MSYHVWTQHGIGICLDEISLNEEKIVEIGLKTPGVADNLKDAIDATDCYQDAFEEYDLVECLGAATLISDIIKAKYPDLYLVPCNDFDGKQYIVYPPCYPWAANDFDRSLTKNKICEILASELSRMTNTPVEPNSIDNCCVENGG